MSNLDEKIATAFGPRFRFFSDFLCGTVRGPILVNRCEIPYEYLRETALSRNRADFCVNRDVGGSFLFAGGCRGANVSLA
jgi:hypothetical protein